MLDNSRTVRSSVESEQTCPRYGLVGSLIDIPDATATAEVAQMMRHQIAVPPRSYDRTWEEIEDMLEDAVLKQKQWKLTYAHANKSGDRQAMKDAARNHKALEGVIKTLRWVLGEQGVEHPLH